MCLNMNSVKLIYISEQPPAENDKQFKMKTHGDMNMCDQSCVCVCVFLSKCMI